jgi:FHS family L-fucose permease-like MFS transporter
MQSRKALFIIGVLFFIFGYITWLNGTLIPYLKQICNLSTDVQAFLVTFAFYIAYFFLALPSAYILEKTGYRKGMAIGLVVMAVGALLFVPAAHQRSFPLFLVGLFVQASGMSLLQTAANPYVTILGPLDSAASRISIMGICNKGAGILSPIILSAIILKKGAPIDELAGRIIPPYIVMAGILILMAVLIRFSSLPEINPGGEDDASRAGEKTSIFQFPHLLLGVLCIFLYVGVEVLAGDGIGAFGRAIGIEPAKTAYFTSFTMVAMLVGYVTGIITIPRFLSQSMALRISAITGLVFGVGVLLTHGYAAITCIALLGLSNALMWPAIWPLALEGLGKFTKIGSAMLIMGILGGAVFPLAYPALRENAHLPNSVAFCVCTLPCYVYILYYAVRGHRAGRV